MQRKDVGQLRVPGAIWGRVLAKASFRLARHSASQWAQREIARISCLEKELEESKQAEKARAQNFYVIAPPYTHAHSCEGDVIRVFADDKRQDSELGAMPTELEGVRLDSDSVSVPARGADSAGATQGGRPDVVNVAQEASAAPGAEPVLHASRENAEKNGARSWMRPGFHERLTKGQAAWLDKLKKGDLSGVDACRCLP